MTLSIWLTFIVAAAIIAISPGSGAVLSMSHGLSYGVRKTTATILGLQAGLLAILVIAGAGVGSLLLASETAFNMVKTVGALYLIYLGASQWRAKVDVLPDARPTMETPAAQVVAPSPKKRFLLGFFTNATNPKGIIFMVAVLPQFITPNAALLPQLAILAMTMCTIDLIVMHSYAYAASTMQHFFRNKNAVKKQNRFFGGVLMAVGGGLFFVKRSSGA